MERSPQTLPFCWIVVLILVCTHAESLFASHRGPNDPRARSASLGHGQTFAAPVSDPRDHPPAVVVRCHSDSMELLLQADLFSRGLRVDGRHLRLGPSSAAEGGVCVATPSREAEFTIWAPLMGCGMKRSVRVAAFAG